MTDIPKVFETRADFSRGRLEELRQEMNGLEELAHFTDLTIFGAGSFARHEASKFSDIDMFFLCSGQKTNNSDPRTKELRLFGKMIEVVERLKFPKFSNDCEYLSIISTDDIIKHLGSPTDDHENYFTARMLMLLESKCLFGEIIYNRIIADIVSSYFGDYPDHSQTFQPIFLLNDICRFWKTLLLNYENKRNRSDDSEELEEQKVKQRVRNFKLKFSRMTTCFATISALGSYNTPVSMEQVIELVHLTPRERLQAITIRVPEVGTEVRDVLRLYAWFIDMTGLPKEELRKFFYEETQRAEMFQQANNYGNSMFSLLQKLDESAGVTNRLLRYLVI